MALASWQPLQRVQATLSPRAAVRRGTALLAAGKARAAVRLYARAARTGFADAEYRMGRCYIEGVGVPSSRSEGVRWLQQAAERGHVEAQFLLAAICLQGLPQPPTNAHCGAAVFGATEIEAPDFVAARRWAQLAAQRDSAEAQALLAYILTSGPEDMRDLEEADRWYARSAAAGCPQGLLGHALALARKAADENAQREAVACLHRAAEAGVPAALYLRGVASAYGLGVRRNESEAVDYYRRAAAKGHSGAQLQLGLAMIRGSGTPADPSEGETWLRRAAHAGDAQAEAALDQLHGCGAIVQLQNPHPANKAANRDAAIDHQRSVASTSREGIMEYQKALCPCGSGLRSCRCCELNVSYAAPPTALGQINRLVARAREAFATGDAAAAESLCLHILDVAPRVPDALWMLYQIRKRTDQHRAAMALLRRLVAGDPNHLEAALELAAILFDRGDMAAAEPHARNAIRLAPLDARSHKLLAMVLTEDQRPWPGEYHYRRAIELSRGPEPILLANLAWNLKCQGRTADARELYEESVKAAPDVFQTWLGWARLEEADGDFAAARSRLDQAARIRPNDAGLRQERAVLLSRQGNDSQALAELEAPDAPDEPQGAAGAGGLGSYALLEKGRILDRLGRYAEAFACFDEAKRLERERSGKSYFEREARELAERLRRFFVGERVRMLPSVPAPVTGAQPIFILGFPRSGTTLVEQALSSHAKISAGDELPFINEFAESLPRLLGSPLAYPEALCELWMGDNRHGLELLRDVYLRKVQARGFVEPDSSWFTDKMPLNETHLGLIASIFPCSPLIHVLRHPLDSILSAFSHHLTHGYFCALGLESLAHHYVLVADLVDHYRSQLMLRYLPVRYEEMIEDMEGSVRRMLEFVGVPFDPRCVSFHRNRRMAQTPSYAQVAEPLYSRSKFRYRHYMKQLEPVIPILAPTIKRLGYPLD